MPMSPPLQQPRRKAVIVDVHRRRRARLRCRPAGPCGRRAGSRRACRAAASSRNRAPAGPGAAGPGACASTVSGVTEIKIRHGKSTDACPWSDVRVTGSIADPHWTISAFARADNAASYHIALPLAKPRGVGVRSCGIRPRHQPRALEPEPQRLPMDRRDDLEGDQRQREERSQQAPMVRARRRPLKVAASRGPSRSVSRMRSLTSLGRRQDPEMIAHRHLDEGRDVEQLVLLLPDAGGADSRPASPAARRQWMSPKVLRTS